MNDKIIDPKSKQMLKEFNQQQFVTPGKIIRKEVMSIQLK